MTFHNIYVYIQARMSSNRLPGKVLLPIFDNSLVTAIYRRCENAGLWSTRVLISDDSSDDVLAKLLEQQLIPFHRGALLDVLGRFHAAAKSDNLADNDIVIRLTADNIAPDKHFILDLLKYFDSNDISYLGANFPSDCLPYGLNAEVFRAYSLRVAFHNSYLPFDREHVTPYIKRTVGRTSGIGFLRSCIGFPATNSTLNLTIDTASDYAFMLSHLKRKNLFIHSSYKKFLEF